MKCQQDLDHLCCVGKINLPSDLEEPRELSTFGVQPPLMQCISKESPCKMTKCTKTFLVAPAQADQLISWWMQLGCRASVAHLGPECRKWKAGF
jgi:hypothetical protein